MVPAFLVITAHHASAVATIPVSSPSSAAIPSSAPEPCGPSVGVPNMPDTCTAPLSTAGMSEIYGTQCYNNTQQLNGALCSSLINDICTQITGPVSPVANQWNWVSNAACALGFWMPGTIHPAAPAAPLLPAPLPTYDRCAQTIYGGMISACAAPGGGFYPVSVNLQILPSDTGNGLPAIAGGLYMSYAILRNETGVDMTVLT